MDIEVASAATFISLFLSVYLIGGLLRKKKLVATTAAPLDLFVPPVFGGITEGLANVLPNGKRKRELLQKDMLSAGRYHSTAMMNFLATRNALVLTEFIVLAGIFALGIAEGIEAYVAVSGIIVIIFSYSVPRLLIAGQAKSRKSKIEKAIPDVLDLIAMAVAGGLPIASALERVNGKITKSYPALSRELQIICNQCRTGSIEVAFQKFANRIQISEIVSWASLMKQSSRLGGGIAEALQQYAQRIREDRNMRLEKSGNTASIRMLLPVVLCIGPPIIIMLIGPAMLDIRDFLNKESNSPSAAITQFNEAREALKATNTPTNLP